MKEITAEPSSNLLRVCSRNNGREDAPCPAFVIGRFSVKCVVIGPV